MNFLNNLDEHLPPMAEDRFSSVLSTLDSRVFSALDNHLLPLNWSTSGLAASVVIYAGVNNYSAVDASLPSLIANYK